MGRLGELVVPWTVDLLERRELWAIANALDPDVIAVSRLAGPDFAGIVADGDPLLDTGDELSHVERPQLEAVFRAFGRRLPVLQRNGQARPLFSDVAGIRFPCTPVAAIGGDLGPASALRCTAELDLGLMVAAEAGDMADSAIATLARRGVVVTPYELARDDARDRVLRGQSQPAASGAWALSETGLRWLSAVTQSPLTISVVVGDEPWDFALGYALRRMTSLAWWLPTGLLADPLTVPWLVHRIEQIGQLAERGAVASLSDHAAAQSLAEQLGTTATDSRDWSVAEDALEPLHERPSRLFSRAPGLETLALQEGATGFIPPELPRVGEAPGQRIYWMTELLGDNWQPLPDPRLAAEVVRWPSYDSTSARPTRAGAAYLCPHYLRMSDDMASEVVRPRIAVLGLREQLAAILAESGWRLEPSDKGQYAEGAAKLFGDDDKLRTALATPDWWGTLTALRSETAPDEERRGWRLADQRTYYALGELDE